MSEEKTEDFEFQILAAAIRQPGAIAKFSAEVNPFDVGLIHGYTGIHEMYKALVTYHRKIGGDVVDPVAYKSWLRTETDIMEGMGGQGQVDQLIDKLMDMEIPATDAIVKMIEFRANKRRQIDATMQMLNLVKNKGQATDVDTAKIVELSKKIQEYDRELDFDPLSVVRTGKEMAAGVDELWKSLPFIPTQFPNLNKAIGYSEDKGGYMRGSVNAVAAASGLGKTTFVRSLCNYWLDHGETILFVNFEEPQSYWERTLMTQVVKRNVLSEMDHISEKEKAQLTAQYVAKLKEWGNRLMVRHDPESVFFEDLERWLRDVLGRGARQPTVVVIDTIQSMYKKSGGSARWGQYEEMMVALEKLAKDMNAVFLITAQQNTDAVKGGREVLNQGDMGGSISILQKSTIGFFLVRVSDKSEDQAINPNLMEAQIVKNRITGTAFTSNPPLFLYNDAHKSYAPFKLELKPNEFLDDSEEIGDTY